MVMNSDAHHCFCIWLSSVSGSTAGQGQGLLGAVWTSRSTFQLFFWACRFNVCDDEINLRVIL